MLSWVVLQSIWFDLCLLDQSSYFLCHVSRLIHKTASPLCVYLFAWLPFTLLMFCSVSTHMFHEMPLLMFTCMFRTSSCERGYNLWGILLILNRVTYLLKWIGLRSYRSSVAACKTQLCLVEDMVLLFLNCQPYFTSKFYLCQLYWLSNTHCIHSIFRSMYPLSLNRSMAYIWDERYYLQPLLKALIAFGKVVTNKRRWPSIRVIAYAKVVRQLNLSDVSFLKYMPFSHVPPCTWEVLLFVRYPSVHPLSVLQILFHLFFQNCSMDFPGRNWEIFTEVLLVTFRVLFLIFRFCWELLLCVKNK